EAPALLADDPAETTLKTGLSDLLARSPLLPLLDQLTVLISAAFDKAALAIEAGGDRKAYEAAIAALLDGLADPLRR
ncbi:TetR/AcrR family transcriptional regulator, partial [Neorhizobium sp. T786]|nr:TetR/AcrR family transcriptional regulator [Neorhizobium xiangyangii]